MATIDAWEDLGDSYNYMHVVESMYVDGGSKSKETYRKHRFLEFLASLKILEYSRGYDGIYYDVRIMKRGK